MRTKNSYLFLIFIFLNFSLLAQNSLPWAGDLNKIIQSSDGSIQSNGIAQTDIIRIFKPSSCLLGAIWKIDCKLAFDVTSSNYLKIFLAADSVDSKRIGYGIVLNGTNNSIDLFYYNGTSTQTLISGKKDRIASKIETNIQITAIYTTQHQWYLYSDTSNDRNHPILEGFVESKLLDKAQYTMVEMIHTSTRKDKFFIQPFECNALPNIPIHYNRLSNHTFSIQFSDNIGLYDTLLLLPDSILAYPTHQSNEIVEFLTPVFELPEKCISIQMMQWLHPSFFGVYQFCKTDTLYPSDIIFTEIMVDPEPSQELPPVEYIEIKNRLSKDVTLKNIQLRDRSDITVLPDSILPANVYMILTNPGQCALFPDQIHCLELDNMISLNNASDEIALYFGEVCIDRIAYTDDWYKNALKKTGGFSLEKIDITNFCLSKENWCASKALEGGTPGMKNSVDSSINSSIETELEFARQYSNHQIDLHFNLPVWTNAQTSFFLNNSVAPDSFFMSDEKTLHLIFNTELNFNTPYIKVIDLSTCQQTTFNRNQIPIIHTESAIAGDLVFNEIYFDPPVNGFDFIELYNRSDKYIDLSTLQIVRKKNQIIDQFSNWGQAYIIQPKQYIAFTENKSFLLNHFLTYSENNCKEISNLPDMNNDEGHIVLVDTGGQIIDEIIYNENMHHPMLTDTEDISLEKIHPDFLSLNSSHWQSAASAAGYATPGVENSQKISKSGSEKIIVEPDKISLTESNQNTYAGIRIHPDVPGSVANIFILSTTGQRIKTIAHNQLVGDISHYTWDGTDENNSVCMPEIYLVVLELFEPTGKITYARKKVYVF